MEFATEAIGSLLPKLGKLLKEEYKLRKGVKEQVKFLSRELESTQAALRKVAKVPREQLDELVKLWTRDIRELSYDMEDIVDTFLVRVEDGREATATPNPKGLKKLIKKMVNFFSKSKNRHEIADAIKDISMQLQEVANRRDRFTADSIVARPAVSTPIDPRLLALYEDAAQLVGIDGPRDMLINMLSEGDDASNKKKIKVVSVVGFGGLGKTTLAKAVYDNLKAEFDCCAFVPVGQNPDMKKVLRDICIDLKKEYNKKLLDKRNTNLGVTMLDERQLINQLQELLDKQKYTMLDEKQFIEELRDFLENKRYLVVIDDIWDVEAWEVIKRALIKNDRGNTVITTTRHFDVAQRVGGAYELKPLCPASSKFLFYGRIFGGEDKCPDQLAGVSEKILKKCGGVPLAIITVASLLASKMQDAREWKIVLDSIGAGLEDSPHVKDMRKILALSYYHLPYHLKACLLYLSVFPEDYEIDRDNLIWRWIAEGFVQPRKQETTLFEVGESYFNELINRSMIQPAWQYMNSEGIDEACRVHDMVLDLICDLSNEENFVTILDGTEESTPNSQSKVRRLSIQNSKVDETIHDSMSQVRSITLFRDVINLMPHLLSFRVLRVLDLGGCDLGESINLKDVGNLFHLRYLGLPDTGIFELPEEIGELQFLQVLDVGDNYNLKELPPTIVKLRKLMCLLVHDHLTRLPDGMGELTSLEVLDRIHTKACPNFVKELHNLKRLRELRIFFDEDEKLESEEAFMESLRKLRSVQSLVIDGFFRSVDLFGEHWVPPQHLRKFRLDVYRYTGEDLSTFSTLPAWVKRYPSHLSKLFELCINVKELRQEDLQILGRLPALRSLEIHITHRAQRLLHVGADGFRSMMCFNLGSSGNLMFQRGVLPRAQEVYFNFYVRMAKDDGNIDFDSGLGNLPSLRKVHVTMFGDVATDGEVEQAKAALRHAIDTHPNHPTIEIDFVPDTPPESDDDEMDVFGCEESPASDGDDNEDGSEKSRRPMLRRTRTL